MGITEDNAPTLDLRRRLEEAEDTLRAIRSGEVDALLVEGTHGSRVFTIQGADHPYRVLIEAMQQGAASLSCDGTILFCNQCLASLLKKSPSLVVGSAITEYFPAASRPTVKALLLAAQTRREHAELYLEATDGSLTPIHLDLTPITLTHAEAICMIVTDQTGERKRQQLEEAMRLKAEAFALLRASEQRMRLATEATAVGIWEWNLVSNDVRWDSMMYQIYGIEPTASGVVTYREWADRVAPEDLEKNESALKGIVESHGQGTREFRIRRRNDGELRWIRAVETVRMDEAGRPEWVVGTNLDVTEQKLTENRLRQLASDLSEVDRRKDEFLATLAHELRNPLAPLRNGLELMKLAGDTPEVVKEVRTMMERQVSQMVRLVDDLMDVSRISLGKLELRTEPVALADVLNSAIETSRPIIEQMGHELTVQLPQSSVMIVADLVRLAQVFLNLLNNAAKYSAPGGKIRLTATRRDDEVHVSVTDTGIGMTGDQLSRIFEMFTQVDSSLERAQGGLGIGLSLVKRLVEMHGGTVEAKSEGPGKGSEFIVILPVGAARSGSTKLPAANSAGTKHRILIVDDNRDAADSLAMMLQVLGHTTQTAYDGQQGVDAFDDFRPNVVLLDIGLPVLNGYEACRRIRERASGPHARLIAVTGLGQGEDRNRSREAGFDCHLVKPVDPRQLIRNLANVPDGAEK